MQLDIAYLRARVGNGKVYGDGGAGHLVLQNLQFRADPEAVGGLAVLLHIAHIFIENILLLLRGFGIVRDDEPLGNGMTDLAQVFMEMADKIGLSLPINPIQLIFIHQRIEFRLGKVANLLCEHVQRLLVRERILPLKLGNAQQLQLQPLPQSLGDGAGEPLVDELPGLLEKARILLALDVLRKRDSKIFDMI